MQPEQSTEPLTLAPVTSLVVSTQFLVLNEISIIAQLSQAKAEKQLAPQLNMPQFIVLNHLTRRNQPSSLVTLADAIQVTKGAMTNTVSKLLSKEFVTVRPDPKDGRGKLVTLTEAGKTARAAAVKTLGSNLSGLSELLTENELTQMQQLLQKMRVWFDANRQI